MKIFLSVGHSILKGGGCTSASGFVNEYRYNKELAPYVKNALESRGHLVDIVVCPEGKFTNKTQEKGYKLPIANNGKYDLVAELHLNASNGIGNGSECLYYPGDTRGKTIAERFSNKMAELGFKNRGAKARGDLYIIAQSKPLAVLFESFFCDNKYDTDLAKKLGYEQIANAIAYAITNVDKSLKNVTGDGWKKDNGVWYYYKNGKNTSGWLQERGKWYYLQSDGKMKVGWLEYNKNWFFFESNGQMKTGWLEYNNEWYHFNEKGYMTVGWYTNEKNKNDKFYFDKNGKMLKGKHTIDGKIYYFDDKGYLKKPM